MRSILGFCIVFFLSIVSASLFSQNTFSSVQTGNWDDASTWTVGGGAGGTEGVDYPAPTDEVYINSGDTVYLNVVTSTDLYSFEGYMEVDTAALFWIVIGDNEGGLSLEGNARLFNRGEVYTGLANEGPGTVGPYEIDIYLEDNSIYYAYTGSNNYCSDDIHIRGNGIFYVEQDVCVEVDDDFHLNGTNSLICGDGGASIGLQTAANQVIYEAGASSNNICDGLIIYRGPGGTCDPVSGTVVVTGDGPTNLPPRAVDDNVRTAQNTALAINVLYLGLDDIELEGETLEIDQLGSNGAINDNTTVAGGTLSINDNGTPGNTADDYVDYTPPAGFIGGDSFQYIISDGNGGEDTATVSITVDCGARSITTYTYTYAAFESETNDVVDELEAEGAPDGLFAQIYNNNETLTLDMGQVYDAGTQYEITWRRRNTVGSGTAIIDLSESTLPGSGFVTHPVSPENTDNVSFTTTVVTSNSDFRYIAFDKGNSSVVDYEIDAVGVRSGFSCESDFDEDGIADDLDADDDNDGIPDENEGLCGFVTNVQAFWPMENNTDDVSGNGFNAGSGTNNPTFSTDAIQGAYSADFNGVDDQVRYSVDGGFMESDYTNVSFSAWIKPSSLSGTRIIYEEGGGTNGLILWLNNNVLTFTVRNGGGGSQTDLSHPTTLSLDGNWHHVACTFDNGLMKVFYDGVPQSTTAAFTNIPDHGSDGGIAGNFGNNSAGISGNYAGLLDAARYTNSETWLDADIANEAQSSCDSDNDGLANRIDLDSDNDGVPDIIEAGGLDANGDGIADNLIDTDADGLVDLYDSDDGGTPLVAVDEDGDGLTNNQDIDSDADGIVDYIEAQRSTASPTAPVGSDLNGNGIDDAFDAESGSSVLVPIDSDADGIPDYLDSDSDNDGYSDLVEAYDSDNDNVADQTPLGTDSDFDGLDDQYDNVVGPNPTSNVTNNGQSSNDFPNLDEAATPERDWRETIDTDQDGVADFFDEDDDNDGIPDLQEASCSNPIISFIGTVDAFWAMENNTDDISGNSRNSGSGTNEPDYSTSAVQGNFSASFNGTNDEVRYSVNSGFMEEDYTNISFSAWIKPSSLSGTRIIYEEGGSTNGSTLWLNGNTLTYSTRDGSNQIDVIHPQTLSLDGLWHHVACTFDNGTLTVYLDGVGESTTAPYSNISPHSSDGGVGGDFSGNAANTSGNYAGLLDAARYSFTESWSAQRIAIEAQQFCDDDNDGLVNSLDLDSDNDGITDLIEAGGSDADGDGRVDGFTDSDDDGLTDLLDPDDGGTPLADLDSDGDGIVNRLDLDSDNDGITDIVEAQASGSFVSPSDTDTDGDGLDDSFDPDNGGTAITLNNQDGAGGTDYISLDTDGDGLFDWSEGFDDNNSLDALDDLELRADNFETAAGNPLFYINSDDADADNVPDWLEDDDADNLPNFLDPVSPFYQDTDEDGLVDLYDPDNFGVPSNTPDGDADGLPDYRDLDEQISLPVELDYFNARKSLDQSFLSWATYSEINNKGFEVQRSSDGEEFETIAFVSGNGNSNQYLEYQLIDQAPLKSGNYYRLIQIDFDGKRKDKGVRYLDFSENQKPSLKLFPNPNQGNSLNLKFEEPTVVDQLRIIDLNGKLVYQLDPRQEGDFEAGDQLLIQFPAQLLSGTYLVILERLNQINQYKLIVQ